MAAGLGFKDFTTGEVLTAADVDGYLMQGIWVFASTAARDAAVTAPAEGNFAFTKDTNSLWYYDGAAWVASGAAGDIEGVTAGVGISGGGTSGTVTITNSMATAIDAKGDLVAGTGADTFAKLTVGADNTILTADSSTATGLKWAAAAGGGGKVLQVVNATTTTATTIDSTTMTDTGITATITPTLNTSKILVLITGQYESYRASSEVRNNGRILRGATAIASWTGGNLGGMEQNVGTTSFFNYSGSWTWLDSPATTSATTYKFQYALVTTAGSSTTTWQQAGVPGSITLLEIGA